MKLAIVAVGQRMPDWAQAAFDEYAKRMPPELRVECRSVKSEPRASRTLPALLGAERERIEAAIRTIAGNSHAHIVALDERGAALTTMRLAQRIRDWQLDATTVVFVIGGADGLDPALRQAAHECIRLSDLTLPHALARVLLIEQLYRGWSINVHHPYHRE